MATYCLPRQYASAFMNALKGGLVNPADLMDMTSAERRTFFEPIVGAENAQEVNALFESKMLLQDVKRGLVTWAKQVGGISEPARRDLLSTINRMPNEVLSPANERKFLADLAERRLGVSVTADEAQEIFDLAQKAEAAKVAMKGNTNPESWTAYGRALLDLTDRVEAMKPNGRTWGKFALEVANVPRSIMSTLDLSAPLVQGWGLEASGNWRDAFGRMFGYLRSEENYQNLRGWIAGHPDFESAQKAGLSLTELSTKLSAREESIQSTLVEKASGAIARTTGLPNAVRASNRAFVGFLNYARFKTFADLKASARAAGLDVSEGSEILKDFARTINNFSGRGEIGGQRAENLITGLNAVFFAPRKTVGTIQMFNPTNMLNPKINKMARIKATKMLMGSVLYTAAIVGFAKAVGFEVNLDPRHTDFLKIQIGRQKFDITGGNAIYLRLMARMASNQAVTTNDNLVEFGEGFRAPTRADELLRFARGKLAPVAAGVADAMYGADMLGRPFSVTQEMRDKLVPMTMNNLIEYAMTEPADYAAALPALTTIFGVGMQSPLPNQNGSKRDVWGEPNGTEHDDPVDRTLRRVGIAVAIADKKIRGVELTDAQYDTYQQISGRMMKMALSTVIRTPGFERLPLGRQEQILRDTMAAQREQARIIIMMKNPDIPLRAQQLKRTEAAIGTPAAVARRQLQ